MPPAKGSRQPFRRDCLKEQKKGGEPRFNKRRPRAQASSRRRFFRKWRMWARAFPVTTKFSHVGLGVAPGAVRVVFELDLRELVRPSTSPATSSLNPALTNFA
jgi:hypothetical protein